MMKQSMHEKGSERFLNQNVVQIKKSGIRKFFDVASTMSDVISLGVGEPDFVTPFHIRNAAIDSLLDGQTQYTPNAGLLELRKEISLYLNNRFHTPYNEKDEILVTVGASEGIDLAARACFNPGDEVLIPDPSYVSYAPCVLLAGAVPVPVQTYAEDNFAITAENIQKHITERTKSLIFPYPNNPTGAIEERAEMLKIASLCEKHDLLIISDEIYAELTYSGMHISFPSLEGMKERTILINGFSKAFAMTGFRIGYVCAPKALIEQMNKIHQYAIMCASRQSQVGAIQALKRGRMDNYNDIATMKESYDQRRRLMLHAFEEMGLPCFTPQGAFYAFPSIQHTGLTSEDFCTRLLEQEHVVCVPGDAFGESGEGYIRCCYATDIDQMTRAFEKIKHFLSTL